ncbi:MAG: redoxin domain-containing protein [Armatimonadota bacterium]
MESKSQKPDVGKLIPSFDLESVDGKSISTWDFKEKMGLFIVFFNPRNSTELEALAEINHRYHEITEENAEVLAVGSGPVDEMKECIASLHLQFPLMSDPYGEAACAFNAAESTILVADKFGELRMKASLLEDLDTALNNAISILDLAELECPECSVSSWPEEE